MSAPKTRRELGLLATGGLVASALAASYSKPAAARQPIMEQARATLGDALHLLETATADKGGYRVAAIRSVKEAISQIDAGMRFDETH
jgi:hypothetical protein